MFGILITGYGSKKIVYSLKLFHIKRMSFVWCLTNPFWIICTYLFKGTYDLFTIHLHKLTTLIIHPLTRTELKASSW